MPKVIKFKFSPDCFRTSAVFYIYIYIYIYIFVVPWIVTILIRSNKMQQYAGILQIYMFQVSIALIIRSTQNCKCSLWYRSLYLSNNLPPTWPNKATEEGLAQIL